MNMDTRITSRAPRTSLLFIALLWLAASAPAVVAGPWKVLFDGQKPEGLRGYRQASFPSQNWVVENGALKTVPGKSVDLSTTEKYRNFDLRFEWKVAPGGNSGVMYNVAEIDAPAYATGPEYQVLDDSKHADGKNPKTSAGALYALIAPSTAKVLKPVGEFNQGRIVSRNGKVDHYVNGRKVVSYTWGSPEVKALVGVSKFKSMPSFMQYDEGFVVFQHHGEEAWYRNIRIRRF